MTTYKSDPRRLVVVTCLFLGGIAAFTIAARAGADSPTDPDKSAAVAAGATVDPTVLTSATTGPTVVPVASPSPTHILIKGVPVNAVVSGAGSTTSSSPSTVDGAALADIQNFYALKHFPTDAASRTAIVSGANFAKNITSEVASIWIPSQVNAQAQDVIANLNLMAENPSLSSISATKITMTSLEQETATSTVATVDFTGTIADMPAAPTGSTPAPNISNPYQFQTTLNYVSGKWLLATLNAVPTTSDGQ